VIGQTISHYRIIEKLGEGGMGVVYKARDTRLDRFVAIKVLPAEKVADPERKERFVQEAKAASSLNHPNIITIYDIGQAEGVDFISMECVVGKTLDQLIPRRGMRLNEALKCAVQIADALARAHSAGIVHRDLKPGNIMVNEHGLVKVLDFGLAKLTEPTSASEDDATRTLRPSTEEGKIVGTVAYMSPEQAEGKKVDARSDIFSFGSVLYEMVTGGQAFHGDTKASTLAAILKDNPRPASQLVDRLPREVERLISRCLRKEVDQRSQHMDDVKIALQELKEESDSGVLGTADASRPNPRRRLHWVLSVAAALVIATVGVWLLRSKKDVQEAPLVAVPLTSYPGNELWPSFSPDGTQVAFTWDGEKQDNSDIYVKQIGVEPAYRLTNDPAMDYSPAWSPDGRSIAFLREVSAGKTAIMLIPQRGGSERILAEIDGAVHGLAYGPFLCWTPDSRWLVVPTSTTGQRGWGLHLFSRETGEQRPLTNPPIEELGDTAPAVSPDGRTLVFSRISPDYYNVTLWLLRLGEGYKPLDREEKIQTGQMTNTSAAWLPDGTEFVFSSGTGTDIGLSRITASKGALPRRISLDVSAPLAPAISRLGNRLAFVTEKDDLNIWRIDLKGPGQKPGLPFPFISSTQVEYYPAFSPDGRRIAFMSQRSGTDEIWICDSDGSKAAQLTSLGGSAIYGPNWSPDGQNIAFTAVQKGMKEDIYSISVNGGTPRRLTTHPAEDKWPYWSHDGKWIYFSSTRSGREEIWKMPSNGGEAVQITRNSGDAPQESPDGKFLYYMKGWPDAVSVWRASVDGNQEAKVLDSVHSEGQWAVGKKGIFFFKTPDKIGHSDISFYEFATGQIRKIVTIQRPVNNHIAVSPDGRTILYPQSDESGSVLMLVENFR
jgi:Tol biopolymer transport system component/tRNA A-37 threonylcarbamoyl transferase component Bud32